MSSSFNRNRLRIVAVVVIVALGWLWYSHHTYVADVREICTAESRTETTIGVGRKTVEAEANAKLKSGSGAELLKEMQSSTPHDAAILLRRAASSAGVSDCTSVASYEKLAARKLLNEHAQLLCRRLDPTAVAKVPRDKRAEFVVQWAHDQIHEDDVDALLAPVAALPVEEALPRIKELLSTDADVHACGFLPGLTSRVSPESGPNMIIQSAGVPTDERDKAMKDVFQAKADDFVGCYKQGLAADPKLTGTLKVKFRLTDKGAIDFALAQNDSTLHSQVTATCVTDLVKTIHAAPGKATNAGGLIIEFWVAP